MESILTCLFKYTKTQQSCIVILLWNKRFHFSFKIHQNRYLISKTKTNISTIMKEMLNGNRLCQLSSGLVLLLLLVNHIIFFCKTRDPQNVYCHHDKLCTQINFTRYFFESVACCCIQISFLKSFRMFVDSQYILYTKISGLLNFQTS